MTANLRRYSLYAQKFNDYFSSRCGRGEQCTLLLIELQKGEGVKSHIDDKDDHRFGFNATLGYSAVIQDASGKYYRFAVLFNSRKTVGDACQQHLVNVAETVTTIKGYIKKQNLALAEFSQTKYGPIEAMSTPLQSDSKESMWLSEDLEYDKHVLKNGKEIKFLTLP